MAPRRPPRDAAPTDSADAALERLGRLIDAAPAGLHDAGPPAIHVPATWPATLAELYLAFDGLRLFHDAIEVLRVDAVQAHDGEGPRRWRFGSAWGGDLWVDDRGRVLRSLDDDGALVVDGTSPARWLSGALDAEALVVDADGEYVDDAFGEDGELAPEVATAQLRARVRRDPRAVGPRWALARALVADLDDGDAVAEARDLLERVVADEPRLPWAWLDLARISEHLGERAGAVDEAEAAATAAAGDEHEAFFWAHAARLAAAAEDEPRRAALAARCRAADAGAVGAFVAGAADNLAAGDPGAARVLTGLARAVAPRDLAVLDLERKLAE